MTENTIRLINEMMEDPEMAKYGYGWYRYRCTEKQIYKIHLQWSNNKSRKKHGIAPKQIEDLPEEEQKLPKGAFIDAETGMMMIRTTSGLEEYQN